MNKLRLLGLPFAFLYGLLMSARNHLYNKGLLESREYDIPIICVGNLSMGGTGKSPMIAYLVKLLKDDYKVGVLSRGYGRKTSGYLEVETHSTAKEVGDEPLQLKQNFPSVLTVVCEDRRTGIEKMKSRVEVILLDDAFQHRKVKADLNILLTPFNELYLDDYIVPAGRLREPTSGARRADVIIVTKCPQPLSYAIQQQIQFRMQLLPHQRLYFSRIGYDSKIYGKSEIQPLRYLIDKKFTLLTGIANPDPLVAFLKEQGFHFDHEKFKDHHYFSEAEIKRLSQKDIILATEKDYVRLQPHLDKFAMYFLPIKTVLLNEQNEFFEQYIKDAIKNMG